MRFAEKTFEVRFCATLSAAAMPFDRNPQWYGMTQAQERMNGIDTMIRVGGQLLIFQFKAKSGGKFHLEKTQWRNLARIERRYPNSTLYVLPEAEDVATAASTTCLLKHSWCCSPSRLGQTFKRGAQSTTLTLDPGKSCLSKSRPKLTVGASKVCSSFGCFCPVVRGSLPGPGGFTFWLCPGLTRATSAHGSPHSIFADTNIGIPFGDGYDGNPDRPPIISAHQFEEMLGEHAKRTLKPGLFGLFAPWR